MNTRTGKTFVLGLGGMLISAAPVWAQGTTPAPGDITPAGLLVAATTIAVTVASIVSVVILRIMDNRFKERDERRAEENRHAENQTDLIQAILTLGKGMSDGFAARDQEQRAVRMTLETKEVAQDGRTTVITEVNRHTDGAHQETQKLIADFETRLNNALATLTDAQRSIDKRLGRWDDTVKDDLATVHKELTAIKDAVVTAKDSPSSTNLKIPALEHPASP